MPDMAQPTVTETKATQYNRFLRFINDAAAVVFDQLGPKEAIAAVEQQSQKLAVYLGLVITALRTDQELVLVSTQPQPENPPLLQYVGKINQGRVGQGRVGKFEAKKCFKKGNLDGVKFSGFGTNFTNNFLEKVEENMPGGDLKAHKLLRGTKDTFIIVALGETHETYLGDLYFLLTQQANGENGFLLTNGYANIFYIRDAAGTLWAVLAYWRVGGWYVDASSIGYPYGWRADRQVVSR